MDCLIVGSRGMLGKRVSREARAKGWTVRSVARSEADFCLDLDDPESLSTLSDRVKPDVVINCAALTDIDLCERDWEAGRRVNALVPKELARLATGWGAYLIHISTDHFYSGDGRLKHWETDPVTIVNNYARAKLLGEQHVLAYPNGVVVRTNILGFRLDSRKNTLIEWVLASFLRKKKISGFQDFYTSGMPVGELARVLLRLAEGPRPTGRWNIAGRDVFSKLELIVALGEEFGFPKELVEPAPLASFGGVRRANSLGLDSTRIEKLLDYRLPGLRETVRELHEEYRRSDEVQKFLQSRQA